MKSLFFSSMLAAIVAASALAPTYANAAVRPDHTGGAREAAIHECSTKASKYSEAAWGDVEFQVYRECMFDHGQVE
jgi:hypothetical protein